MINYFPQIPLGLGYLKSNCETADISISVVKNKANLTSYDLIGFL